MIRGALFDMDGVLIDSEAMGRDIFYDLARERGYDVERNFFIQLLGITDEATNVKLRKLWGADCPCEEIQNELRRIRRERAHRRGRHEKIGRFVLIDVSGISGRRDIFDLPRDYTRARFGESGDDFRRVLRRFCRCGERERLQSVAGEYSVNFTELFPDGRITAAHLVVVHRRKIVVDKRVVVKKLYRRRGIGGVLGPAACGHRGAERD